MTRSNVKDLADYAVIQINDTHPTLIIPELIRLLTTEHDIEFSEAVEITRNMVAFTNHTILSEALEKWPLEDIEEVTPIISEIIEQLDQMIKSEFSNYPKVHIIDDNDVIHMARLAIHFGFSTNGVSELHTEILKDIELHDFYKIYPEKFSNKTNGITFRRWLMAANPELTSFLNQKIGTKWHKDADLKALLDYQK